jgi:lipoate-protein ligase A
VKYALRRGFEKAFTLKLADGSLTEEEKLVSDTLLEEKYSQETWNFKR